MADVDVGFRVQQEPGVGCGIDPGDVAYIVTVLLHPIDRGVFFAEYEIRGLREVARRIHGNRTIVTNRRGTITVGPAGALIEVISTPGIICLPRLIAGLEQ